nr:hypothetical protein [Tanacetum cinerariifolium]
MNEMIRNNLTVTKMQVNVQYLQQLQPEWSRFVTILKQQHKLDEVSYHKLFDILKQYQNEVNELRAEKLARNANPLALVATAQASQDQYYQTSRSHRSSAPSPKPSIPFRSQTSTRHKGKEIAKPITPPSETVFEEDSDPEQAQRDKNMQKNLALIAKYFIKIYKPTNNNLRTSSNSKNKNVDTTPRYKNDDHSRQFGTQRTVNVAGTRVKVGSQAEFLDMYDVILHDCVSKDVMCSYLQSLSDLDALDELQCMFLHKVKECDCLAQKLSKQTEFVSKKVHTELLQGFAKFKQHSISLEITLQKCKEHVKNDTVCNEKASNVFQKEHEQYFEIQDLKAQMLDKNISISELKKLIEKGKGKSVDTKFDRPSIVRQPNAQRIPKPSVLGKPTHFSDSLERRYFPKTRLVPKTNVSEGLSKPVTAQTLPHTAKKAIVQLILFIVDSGCTKHMTGNLKLLCNFVEKFLGTIRFGNDQFAPILGYGDLVQGNVTINRVYYVEGLNYNFYSVGQFYDVDWRLLSATPTQAWLWHRRLSHLNCDSINLLSKKDILIGLPKYLFRAPTALDMELLSQTCLMPLAIKTESDSLKFVHELKQEMHADSKCVESLEKEIDELKSEKAEFSDMYDVILHDCVSKDVMCSYLQSLSDLDALAELQCMYLHKVKECDCLAQRLSKQTDSVSKKVHTELLQRFAKVEKHSISLEIALQNCKEQVKNDTVCNEKASNGFRKERKQYIKIQDLKAKLKAKNIAISELKKLIEQGKGKFVDTKFDRSFVVRQPNAQRIPKPLVLGKPTPFSNSLDRIYFQKTRSVPKANVSEGLSKPVTAQTLPHTAKKAVSNTNVLKPGMYRIDNRTAHTREPQLPQTFRNTNPCVSTSTGVNHNTNVSRLQLKSNQSKDKVLPNNSQVKAKKTQVEVHPRIPSVSNKKKSVTACKDSLNSRTLNANAVCATCNKCLVDSNHFACVTKMLNDMHTRTKKPNIVQLIIFIVDSGCTKHITGNLKLLCNFVEKFLGTVRFGNDQFAPILGYGDLVAFRKSTCFVRDIQGNDLLTSNRGFNLYTISLQESTSSTPLCLMAKATPTQAWLWHRRLSHLNFDYINLLSKKDIVIGLPKLKYVKDQLYLYSITLQDTSSPNPIFLIAKATSSQAWLWHRRLSHLNFDTINLHSKNDIVTCLPKLKFVKDHL